ncbi:Hsp20/alpha crystallin family protein [Patescibacteria group bacterium]|nr:Hsp20/alpha crystallin family protein [Patescibacteria group bacterium]
MSVFSFFVKSTTKGTIQEVPTEAANLVAEQSTENSMEWYADEYEGQLSVDVYQTKDSLIVRSTIAGVKMEDLEITLNNDVITIRGKRYQADKVEPDDYFYQECYWGGFSRSIVLPVEVNPEGVKANLENGVLTIILPKSKTKEVSIKVEEK